MPLCSEVGTDWVVDEKDNYHVHLPEGNHIVVRTGSLLSQPGSKFNHPNVAATASDVWEFKHYRQSGSKFWTARVGQEFYFVVPKEKIELLPEKGYSYVPCIINGVKTNFNVSGGTTGKGGWADSVRKIASISVGLALKNLKKLAEVALPPAEINALGIGFDIVGFDEERTSRFLRMVAQPTCLDQIEKIKTINLASGYSNPYGGGQGPFIVTTTHQEWRKRRVCIAGAGPMYVSVKYTQIDWFATAKNNGIELPQPKFINHVGNINPPEKF